MDITENIPKLERIYAASKPYFRARATQPITYLRYVYGNVVYYGTGTARRANSPLRISKNIRLERFLCPGALKPSSLTES